MDPERKADNPAAQGNSRSLGAKLSGPLSCVRCKYDLHGLSVRGVCPECGVPVRATLLAVVDPHARELRPLTFPRLTAIGMMLWALGALGAVGVIWSVRVVMLIAGESATFDPGWIREMGWAAIAGMIASAVGAVSLLRPHDRVPRAWRVAATAGVMLYLPLIICNWYVLIGFDARVPSPYPPDKIAMALLHRTWPRLLGSLSLVGIVLLLRPCARMLAARSMVMRTGRADRQTMIALMSTILLWSLGDSVYLAAQILPDSLAPVMLTIGMMFIAAGSVLFTLGLLWLTVDVARLCPVLIEPAPGVSDVLDFGDGE